VLDALKERAHGLVVQPLFETRERLEENVKGIEEELRRLTVGDWMVELLLSIPGCGQVCAWRIRAYTDEIARFATAKKYAAYAGLAPWVRDSNETIRHGRITKRGPEELRTALIQVVMGLRRLKEERTLGWRLMERHEAMKKRKGSGKTIVATARKLATIIWHMLSEKAAFDLGQMVDRKLAKKAREMSGNAEPARAASARREPVQPVQGIPVEEEKHAGVASEKRKKAG
jgi:transposase